jgi:hypothetical protein
MSNDEKAYWELQGRDDLVELHGRLSEDAEKAKARVLNGLGAVAAEVNAVQGLAVNERARIVDTLTSLQGFVASIDFAPHPSVVAQIAEQKAA